MTLAVWAELDEDAPGELVDGKLTVEEVPDNVHEITVTWLTVLFCAWLGSRGFVLGSEAKYAVNRRRGLKADLSVFFPNRPAPPRRGINRTPPDVAVEIISPTPRDARRDRVEKLRDYAAFGVHFYWILDPQLRTLEILERGADGRYTHALDATEGTLRKIPGCEGLVLDLDGLWSELDRLAASGFARGLSSGLTRRLRGAASRRLGLRLLRSSAPR